MSSHPFIVYGFWSRSEWYVGATRVGAPRRQYQHRQKFHDPSIQLVILAAYADERTMYLAEQVAWDSYRALGRPMKNMRPCGVQMPYGRRMTHEERVICGLKSAEQFRSLSPEAQHAKVSKAGKVGAAGHTLESRRLTAANAWETRRREAATCPNCGQQTTASALEGRSRWRHECKWGVHSRSTNLQRRLRRSKEKVAAEV